jgi:3-oxoacyl-[acyl-carrier protein] reductase
LDVLINNAGIASMNHSFLTPLSTAKNILETNVIGTFLFSREAAKLMKKKKWGRIINFVTFAIPFKLEGEAIYAASKAAVVTLTEILSKEFADYGITVNAIAPPAVQTDLIKGVPKEKIDRLLKRQAIHRFGKPEEICNVIDFFVKQESSLITGEVIYMGGV